MDKSFFFLIIVPFGLLVFGILHVLNTTTSESRHAATVAKYEITVGITDYYANSYTNTNNTLTFHDVLRDEDETFVGKSFSVKNNH